MIPGFARVGEAASFLNELGTDRACAFGAEDVDKQMIAIMDITFRRCNLFHSFLIKSTLRDCCSKNNYRATDRLVPRNVFA